MINNLLHPILGLHGWPAYVLVGFFVAAEASIMLGFVFPGETAAILGGVLASTGGVSLPGMVVTVVLCAIVGDSIGYFVGARWGPRILEFGPLRKRQRGIDRGLQELSRRGALAVFLGRFTAFLRAVVPGLAGMSSMHYPTFLAANAAGGIVWGTTFVLLGYFVGQKVEQATGIASYILLGVIVLVVAFLVVRHRRKEKEFEGPSEGAVVEDSEEGRT